ncbi:hypothetical protein ACFV1W_19490 [Kitasatospora sp. NPDC059648]|uniref:hypothetical protein n=1 Tax=Kitasatospora sp. NPDC059648 TaxID=3346894 RepID=UPI0036B7CA44
MGHEDLRGGQSPDTSTTPEVFARVKPGHLSNALVDAAMRPARGILCTAPQATEDSA